jgi:histidinol dehydrogenase
MDVRTLAALDSEEYAAVINRDTGVDAIRSDVDDIIETVRADGDPALRD